MSVTIREAVRGVKAVLDHEGYRYSFDGDKNSFMLRFSLSKSKLGSTTVRILVRPSSSDPSKCLRIISYGEVSMHATEDCMAEVCEFITRANFGLPLGNFELDHNDGELRYKLSMNSKDALPGYDALDDLVSIPVHMLNRYGDGLLAVLMGISSAKREIQRIEG